MEFLHYPEEMGGTGSRHALNTRRLGADSCHSKMCFRRKYGFVCGGQPPAALTTYQVELSFCLWLSWFIRFSSV